MSSLRDFFMKLPERDLLARCIWGEARGEIAAGKLAIAHVVLNRTLKQSWMGSTIREVILKPYQFSCFNDGDPNAKKLAVIDPSDKAFSECLLIANLACDGYTIDPTGGATHYHAKSCKPAWAPKIQYLCSIGKHKFYREP